MPNQTDGNLRSREEIVDLRNKVVGFRTEWIKQRDQVNKMLNGDGGQFYDGNIELMNLMIDTLDWVLYLDVETLQRFLKLLDLTGEDNG